MVGGVWTRDKEKKSKITATQRSGDLVCFVIFQNSLIRHRAVSRRGSLWVGVPKTPVFEDVRNR